MREPARDHVLLVVLQDRRVAGLLAVENDVEDRMQSSRAGQRPAQLALVHAERMRVLPASVENAGDQPLPPKPACVGRAALLTLLNLELDPFACHGAPV